MRLPRTVFWADRTGGTILVGLGSVYAIETEKADSRFDDVEAGRRRWEKEMEPYGAADAPPLLFGGFSFDPYRPGTDIWRGFPAGKLVAPAALLAVRNGKTTLTVTVPTDKRGRDWERVGRLLERISDPMAAPKRLPRLVSDEEEEKERWLAAVREAIASIRAGRWTRWCSPALGAWRLPKRWMPRPYSSGFASSSRLLTVFAFEQDGRWFYRGFP